MPVAPDFQKLEPERLDLGEHAEERRLVAQRPREHGLAVALRRVQVGLLSNGSVEIRDGLKDGELVVARSGAFLREGDPVRPVVAKKPSSSNPR